MAQLQVRAGHRWVVCDATDAKRAGVTGHPLHYRHAVEVAVNSIWVERDLDADWRVAYRLVVQGGHLVVGEVRVYPLEEDVKGRHITGSWSGDLRGIMATVPAGGLTATTLKRVTIGTDVTQGREVLDDWHIEKELAKAGVASVYRPPREGSPDGGPRSLPQGVYAEAVAVYAEAVAAGSRHPVVDTAKALKRPVAWTRDLIHRARRYGFLQHSGQGRARADLTPEGKAAAERWIHRPKRAGRAVQKKGSRSR